MRTYSHTKVKHFPRNAREIHHLLRDSCDAYRMRDDAHEDFAFDRVACHAHDTARRRNYDAFIIDAEQRDDGVALEFTITSGAHRGDVVNIVTSSFATRDALSLRRFAVHD